MTTTIPRSDIDLYSDELILSPYPGYRELRDIGPAVWLGQTQVWVVTRYHDVYAALHDHEAYSSGSGVGLTEELNQAMIGSSIASDPPHHDHIRNIVGRNLTPKALRGLRDYIQERADQLIDQLVEQGAFDGVRDFAQAFPTSVVPDLLGWPEEGREHFLDWASAGFNALGPMNERTVAGMPALHGMWEYLDKLSRPGQLRPGSWGDLLVQSAEGGEYSRDLLPTLLGEYLTPSLDTTIAAVSSALMLLGAHPEQWAAVRQDPSLIPNAFNEAIRYESPTRGFYRVLTEDRSLGGVTLTTGSRVLLVYASANRDERYWQSPDTFDVKRENASSHVGFGHGLHGCVGQGLARLEGHSLLTALAKRVRRIEIGEPVWRLHNTIRGLASLPVTVDS